MSRSAGLRRVFGEGAGVVFVQLRDHLADERLNRLAPDRQVPGEEVAFEKVGDPHLVEDAALLQLFQLPFQLSRRSGALELFHLPGQPGVEIAHDLRRQQLDEDGVVGVDGEEERRRLGLALYYVEVRQLPQLVRQVLHVVTADLAEQDLPLVEENLSPGVFGRDDFLVERSHAFLGDGAPGSEIAVQVVRLVGLSFLPEVVERPKKAFDGVAVDLQRLLVRPLVFAETKEEEVLSVRAHAKHALPIALFLPVHVVEALPELGDQGLVGGGVLAGGEGPGLLVLHDHAAVHRIGPSGGDGDVVPGIQLDLCAPGEFLQGRGCLDLKLHLRSVPGRRGLDLVGDRDGAVGDDLV